MKPYGLNKQNIWDSDDKAGGVKYGRNSSSGNLPGKGGDIRSLVKGSDKKKRARRPWKKRFRAQAKVQINKELNS
jgi:hypothetical protein